MNKLTKEEKIKLAYLCGYELKSLKEIYFGCPKNWLLIDDWDPENNIDQAMEVLEAVYSNRCLAICKSVLKLI